MEGTGEGVPTPVRHRRSAEEKVEIFFELTRGDTTVAEVMRRHGLHAADVKRIRDKARAALLKAFAEIGPQSKAESAEVKALRAELMRLKEAFEAQSIEYMLLKKRVD